MARKKRSSKKKQPHSAKSNSTKKNNKQAAPTRQTMSKVLLRMMIAMLVSGGLFYVFVKFAVGGNALWKVFVAVSFPYIYIATRKQFFEAPSLFGVLRPGGTKLLHGLGFLAVTNGLCFALFRFVVKGGSSEGFLANLSDGLLVVLNPAFAFLVRKNSEFLNSMMGLETSTLVSLVLASLLYSYGLAVLFDLESKHDIAEQEPLQMLAV